MSEFDGPFVIVFRPLPCDVRAVGRVRRLLKLARWLKLEAVSIRNPTPEELARAADLTERELMLLRRREGS